MPKDSSRFLCVAEYAEGDYGKVAWRPIGEYLENRKRYIPAEKNEPYIYRGTPSACEVAVFDCAHERKTAAGEKEIKQVNYKRPIEIVEPYEFSNIVLEDTDSVCSVLKKGFTIPFTTQIALVKEQIRMAVVVPTNSGEKKALLFDDKSKLTIFKPEEAPYIKVYTVCIENKPENKTKFADSIDVISLEPVDAHLAYTFRTGNHSRVFMDREPETIDSFIPYTARDFAAIYFKRQLEQAKKNYQFTTNFQLTSAMIGELISCMETAIHDPISFEEHTKLKDPEVQKNILAGMEEILSEVRNDLMQGTELHKQIRAFLMADPAVKTACVALAKTEWLAENDAQRISLQKELESLQLKVDKEQEKGLALETGNADLQAKLDTLKSELQEREAEIHQVSTKLHAAIDGYRRDLSQLIEKTGYMGLNPMPLTSSGTALELERHPTALVRNFSIFLEAECAKGLAEYVEYMISCGYHLSVDCEYAERIANSISMAMNGRTASVVARTDDNCTFNDLKMAIDNSPGDVVLVEGVMGCEPDYKVLAYARHCREKLLVFSIDDSINMGKISSSVYSRIAMVSNLASSHTNATMDPQMLNSNQLAFRALFAPHQNPAPAFHNKCAAAMYEQQNKLQQNIF